MNQPTASSPNQGTTRRQLLEAWMRETCGEARFSLLRQLYALRTRSREENLRDSEQTASEGKREDRAQ